MTSPFPTFVFVAALGVVGCQSTPAPAPNPNPAPIPAPIPVPSASAPSAAAVHPPNTLVRGNVMEPVKAEVRRFVPSRYGFKFRNSFSGSPLPKMIRGLATQLGARVPNRYGLCGGMSSAAADYFFADRTPPGDQTPPAEGSVLYEYLYMRQVDSLGIGMINAVKVGRWMMLSEAGDGGTQARSAEEAVKIKAEVQAKGVALVFLVYGGPDGKTPLWENHQVLAYEAEEHAIKIYDPNDPGDDTARLVLSKTGDGVRVERRTARGVKAVRGIFLGGYTPATPPG